MIALMSIAIAALFFIGILAYYAFSWGYVLSILYSWFVLSAVPTLPHFTVLHFVGFSLFANALIRHNSTSVKKEYKDQDDANLSWFSPWLTLFCAWVIHAIWF
jgi:phosphate/sulfate permease